MPFASSKKERKGENKTKPTDKSQQGIQWNSFSGSWTNSYPCFPLLEEKLELLKLSDFK